MIDEAMLLRECAYNLSGQDPQETKAVLQAAARKIDELRSALQERDAEIERLTLGWNAANVDVLHHAMTITAQRKVLEQAHKALNVAVIQNGCDMIMTGKELRKWEAAITTIKEQLK